MSKRARKGLSRDQLLVVAQLVFERAPELWPSNSIQYAADVECFGSMWDSMPKLTRLLEPYRIRCELGDRIERTRVIQAHVRAIQDLLQALRFTNVDGDPCLWSGGFRDFPLERNYRTVRSIEGIDSQNRHAAATIGLSLDGRHVASVSIRLVNNWFNRDEKNVCEVVDMATGYQLPKISNVVAADVGLGDCYKWDEFHDSNGKTVDGWPRSVLLLSCDPAFGVDYNTYLCVRPIVQFAIRPASIDDALIFRPSVLPWFHKRVDFYYTRFE